MRSSKASLSIGKVVEQKPQPPVKAFLLAAGLGTRLKPLTDEIPKCLVPIDGKPLLQIWLEQLSRYGIDEVLVNTHWRHEKVTAFLESWRQTPIRIITRHEPRLLGSAGTILANRHWVEDGQPFFILYGDNLTNVNLRKILDFHCHHEEMFTLGVFKTADPRHCGIAEVNEAGLVTRFVEKPQEPKSDLAGAGIYVADQRIFEFFPEPESGEEREAHRPLDLGFHILPRLAGRMKAYLIEEFLMDIGTPQRYAEAQILWKEVKVDS